MKTVILAGGAGTRIAEETDIKPKPLIEIGQKPVLWHIMKIYSHYGQNDFVICCGYKGYQIKEYFANYYLHEADVTFDFSKSGKLEIHSDTAESWKVTLVNTGLETMTGGRISRIKDYVKDGTFMLTYGDGVSDVDINRVLEFHKAHGKLATVTSVRQQSRFGVLETSSSGQVEMFKEKNEGDRTWINGGFFVLEPKIFDYLKGDETVFEQEPLERLSKDGQLFAYRHEGFWQSMDTLREKIMLERLWQTGNAPWKIWK
jgi:glucose-1-phosphate cytidylyltransferase